MCNSAQQAPTQVVAALLWRADTFLICQRPASKARGLLWEFVGGKTEPGETKQEALIRECREELAIDITVGEPFMQVLHDYPDIRICLTQFNAALADPGQPLTLLEHNDARWIRPEQIKQYPFCPADEQILVKIQERCGK